MAVNILIWVNILSHFSFLILQLFILPKKLLESGEKRAAAFSKNQAIYNGCLSAGLAWGFFSQDPVHQHSIYVFFLSFISFAGIFGSLTSLRRIFFLQALPGLLGLAAVLTLGSV